MNKCNFAAEIKKFREMLQMGFAAIKDAARIYVKALDVNISAKKAFTEAVPEVPYTVWSTLEKIGRGQLHEKLLLGGGRAQQIMRTLSLADQTHAIEHGVVVLLHDGSTMKIMPENLTSSQVSQVFFAGNIRDIEAQRAWMESRRNISISRNKQNNEKYLIEGSLFVVPSPTSFTFFELHEILRKISTQRKGIK